MKKVISFALLTVMFFVGLANVDFSVVFAEEQMEQNVQVEAADFGMDITESSEISVQSANTDGVDYSKEIVDISGKLEENYPQYNWSLMHRNTTENVTKTIPINVQGIAFPESEVLEAVANTGIASSYGGCGAIAMMGMLEYFARAFGYTEIIADSNDSRLRVKLAEDVLNEVRSIELPGDNTLILPSDYVSAFNNLMAKFNIPGKIVAKNAGTILIGGHRDEYMRIIRDSISKGLPVTMYMGINTGDGSFAEHYTNIYEYDDWFGYNTDTGESLRKSFVKARINKPSCEDDKFYADSEILNNGMGGIIYYEVEYDNNQTVTASDFATQFVNASGQGQYFFSNKKSTVTSANGYTFSTQRLRCSYIENKYLVLSADRVNAVSASLEFVFPNDLRKLEFDMRLWSNYENLSNKDKGISDEKNKIAIQIPEVDGSGNIGWKDYMTYDPDKLSFVDISPNHFTVTFPANVSRIRFYVKKINPTSKRNRGRVVLDNFKFSYKNSDAVHTHRCKFKAQTMTQHSGVCACGERITEGHYVLSSEIKDNKATCKACGLLIDLEKYSVPIVDTLATRPVSANGSYITRDGIFVIDDLDLEAYLAGTLTFYNDAGLAIA